MHHNINNKEAINYVVLLAIISKQLKEKRKKKKRKKTNKKVEYSQGKAENNQHLQQIISILYYLNNIQPRSTQVWNCGGIGFYTNGNWQNVICNCNFLIGEVENSGAGNIMGHVNCLYPI